MYVFFSVKQSHDVLKKGKFPWFVIRYELCTTNKIACAKIIHEMLFWIVLNDIPVKSVFPFLNSIHIRGEIDQESAQNMHPMRTTTKNYF